MARGGAGALLCGHCGHCRHQRSTSTARWGSILSSLLLLLLLLLLLPLLLPLLVLLLLPYSSSAGALRLRRGRRRRW